MKPRITTEKILSILSNEWLNFNEIVNVMGIDDSLDRRYLQLKLKELSRKGKVEYVYYMSDKYWRSFNSRGPNTASLDLFKKCPNCRKLMKKEYKFCINCGARLNISSQSKEMEERELKNSESNLSPHKLNFEKEDKLSFCSECGALMLPSKVNDIKIMKCKCGATKPFEEKQVQMYVLKSNIKHQFDKDGIFFCVCGEKFDSQFKFLNHSYACQDRENYILDVKRKRVKKQRTEVKRDLDEVKVKNANISKEDYSCIFCGRIFQTQASYDTHRNTRRSIYYYPNSEVYQLFQRGLNYRKLKE
jgi:DNA-directed RNA polymerase subunit M/transcription elongation factor TFIIS